MKSINGVITAILFLLLIGLVYTNIGSNVKLHDSIVEKIALGDSLKTVRDSAKVLRTQADMLQLVAIKRDTVWLRARATAQVRRDSVLADPAATPEQLREVIVLDTLAINACSASLETCKQQRENAKQQLSVEQTERRLEGDSLKVEIRDRDSTIVTAEKVVKKQKRITLGAIALAILALLR